MDFHLIRAVQPVYNLYFNTVRKPKLDFTLFKRPVSCLDFHIGSVTFVNNIPFLDSQNLLALVQNDVCVSTVAGAQEYFFGWLYRCADLKLNCSVFVFPFVLLFDFLLVFLCGRLRGFRLLRV